MKTRKTISFLFIISLIFVTFSCTWAGDGNVLTSEVNYNYEGVLISKSYSGYDRKFGYKAVIDVDMSDTIITPVDVFIPKATWNRMPSPNDTTVIHIEYIENIEYGSIGYPSLWDKQFNLCTGFTVKKIAKK